MIVGLVTLGKIVSNNSGFIRFRRLFQNVSYPMDISYRQSFLLSQMHGDQPHRYLVLTAQTALYLLVDLGMGWLVIAQGQNQTHQINLLDTCATLLCPKLITFVKKLKKVTD